jgi:hypothetical protein
MWLNGLNTHQPQKHRRFKPTSHPHVSFCYFSGGNGIRKARNRRKAKTGRGRAEQGEKGKEDKIEKDRE